MPLKLPPEPGDTWIDQFFDWLRGLLDKAERPRHTPSVPKQPPANHSNLPPRPSVDPDRTKGADDA